MFLQASSLFMIHIILACVMGAIITVLFVKNLRQVFIIPEGSAGLLYRHGLFIRRNNAGRHVIWGGGWVMNLIDLRRGLVLVTGQEVLTADGVALTLTLVVTYQVVEPVKAAHETQNWLDELDHLAQLALRIAVNTSVAEAWLGRKPEVSTQLLDRMKTTAEKIGIAILAAEVKDVMPAGLKHVFTQGLKADHSSQSTIHDEAG